METTTWSRPSLPRSRWNRIISNLYQGGHDYRPTGHGRWGWRRAVVTDEFDLVISFYRDGGKHGPALGVEHIEYLVPDGRLGERQLARYRELADRTAEAVRAGRRTLVRCQAGLNRSGLLVGLTLLRLGYTADQAIALIRRRRSHWALCNPHFVRYLHAEERREAGGQSPAAHGARRTARGRVRNDHHIALRQRTAAHPASVQLAGSVLVPRHQHE